MKSGPAYNFKILYSEAVQYQVYPEEFCKDIKYLRCHPAGFIVSFIGKVELPMWPPTLIQRDPLTSNEVKLETIYENQFAIATQPDIAETETKVISKDHMSEISPKKDFYCARHLLRKHAWLSTNLA
jgi:hypothetical protein